jgi:hypothetical protein
MVSQEQRQDALTFSININYIYFPYSTYYYYPTNAKDLKKNSYQV